MTQGRYRWVQAGDLNAFFGLALDNMSNLVIMAGLLSALRFPTDLILYRMIPGTAVGVLVGDVIYTWMAFRLARRTGRADVTAMPLGLDTPSLFGLTFGVLGPALALTGDPDRAWKIGMAVLVLMGIIKLAGAWAGPWVRAHVPRAALLGSIGAVAILLIAYLPAVKIFADPIPGFVAWAMILAFLVARLPTPWRLPGAFLAVAAGTAVHYLLQAVGASPAAAAGAVPAGIRLSWPLPTLGFLEGLSEAWAFLPVAFPFALATIIGGIDVTESAAAAGDDYDTRGILLAEGAATVVAGLCGGVIQSTPYIGHPAYKAMGGRAGYTLATALFIGIGGTVGIVSLLVGILPESAVAPILVFIGIEIMAQAFEASPARHGRAIALSFLPVIADLVLIEWDGLLTNLGKGPADLTGQTALAYGVVRVMGNGFILSSLLWGAAAALLLDGRLRPAAAVFGSAAVCALFGAIHSPLPTGAMFLPWRVPSAWPFHLAVAYGLLACLLLFLPTPDAAGA